MDDSKKKVILGNEILRTDLIGVLREKRVGFIGNHTSLFENGEHVVNFLKKNSKSLTIFGPEHSFEGTVEDQELVGNSERSDGIGIFSLFGEYETPTDFMCSQIDLFVYDVQSVGVRFYTYICTMYNVMEACKRTGIPLYVCDRPNPISCLEETISGPITRPNHCSFFSPVPIPLKHGFTVAELSLFFNSESYGCFPSLNIQLKILKMRNYKPFMFFPSTGIKWTPCSPCMPDIKTALLYPGLCLVEGTNINEGRGTKSPFLTIGAPWMGKEDLKSSIFPEEDRKIHRDVLCGIRIKNIEYTPIAMDSCTKPKYLGEKCFGIQIEVTAPPKDYAVIKPVKLALYILCQIKFLFPTKFVVHKFVDGLFGSEVLRSVLMERTRGRSVEEDYKFLLNFCEFGMDNFRKNIRKKYCLYE